MAYIMLCGERPFWDDNDTRLAALIADPGTVQDFESEAWEETPKTSAAHPTAFDLPFRAPCVNGSARVRSPSRGQSCGVLRERLLSCRSLRCRAGRLLAQAFVTACLQKLPTARAGARQLLHEHAWIQLPVAELTALEPAAEVRRGSPTLSLIHI